MGCSSSRPASNANRACAWQSSRRADAAVFGGDSHRSGVRVTNETALRFTAVFAAIRIRSENVASLPKRVLRGDKDGRIEEHKHPAAVLLCWYGMPQIVVEIGVVLTELAVYLWFSRDSRYLIPHPVLLAVLCNGISWTVGLVIQRIGG